MSVESSVRIPCSSLYFIHVINSFVFGVKESKSRLHCIFLKLSYLAGLAECFIQKSQPTARQAEYLMVGKVCQLLVQFVSDSCTSSPVTMKHGLQLWQKLSKALEPMGKLVPDSLQKDYPVMNCVTQAVGRFGDLLTVGITREIKINMEGEVDVKALQTLAKDFPEPLPRKVATLLHTLQTAILWTEKSLVIDNSLSDKINGPGMQLFLPLYLKVVALDLDSMAKMLPEKHELAVSFIKSFQELLTKFIVTTEGDLQKSVDVLAKFRQELFAVTCCSFHFYAVVVAPLTPLNL